MHNALFNHDSCSNKCSSFCFNIHDAFHYIIKGATSRENQQSAYAKTKDADQLRGNREADQRLCFCYSDSTVPLLLKSSSSFLCLYRLVCVGPIRKPHCWFSHEAAQMLKYLQTEIANDELFLSFLARYRLKPPSSDYVYSPAYTTV